jgi:hypothetical protein
MSAFISFRIRRQLTAWLGLLAIGLLVFAPVVSQVRLAAQHVAAPQDVLCSAVPSGSAPAGSASASGHAHQHDGMLAACGYCGLLADHPAMPPLHIAAFVLFVVAVSVRVPALFTRDVPTGMFSPARPRAPPSLTTAFAAFVTR